jgi:hypothetical protein
MAMSPNLFLAILAMDSYNRGHDPGVMIDSSAIGGSYDGGGEFSQRANPAMDAALRVLARSSRSTGSADVFRNGCTGVQAVTARGPPRMTSLQKGPAS